MSDNDQNSGTSNHIEYDELVESSVGDLFNRYSNMSIRKRMEETDAYCLANALSTHSEQNDETRLEYIKEAGRNARALIKSDEGGSGDPDDGCFG